MPRPMRYPAIAELTEPGQSVLFRGHGDVRRVVTQYAARHGWRAVVERQDESEAVTAELGVLWLVERQ